MNTNTIAQSTLSDVKSLSDKRFAAMTWKP